MQQLELGGRQMNWLNIIRKQILKERKLQEAQYYIATLG
jgi:hypothetical protein